MDCSFFGDENTKNITSGKGTLFSLVVLGNENFLYSHRKFQEHLNHIMKKVFLSIVLCILFNSTFLFAQEEGWVKGKEIKQGVWHKENVTYFDQLLEFKIKNIIPLDSNTGPILSKRFKGKLLEYDSEDGFTLIEFKKGTDILKLAAKMEKDTTVKLVSPVLRFMHYYQPMKTDTLKKTPPKVMTKQDSLRRKKIKKDFPPIKKEDQ